MRTEVAQTFLDAGWTLARAAFAAVSAPLLTAAARHAARAGFLLFGAVAGRGGLPAATRAAVLAFAAVVIVSSAGTASAAPVASSVTAVEGATRGSVSAGWDYSCGVKSDGSLACWGYNSYGQSSPPAGTFR